MKLPPRKFWIQAALVAGAIILPFGSLILIVGAALKRARRARQEAAYADWWNLRAAMREKPRTSAPTSATPETVAVRVD